MIIEAGYELRELVQPALLANETGRQALWLLAMDKDLRFLFLRKVVDPIVGSIEPHIEQILEQLDDGRDQAHYFAIAHMVPRVTEGLCQELHRQDELLRQAASLLDYELIGHLAFDEEEWYSSGPMHSFRDYPGCEDLPRAAVIRGPHPWGCECLACTQREAVIAELVKAARKRVADAALAGDGGPGSEGEREREDPQS
jgi:hypothetical protein